MLFNALITGILISLTSFAQPQEIKFKLVNLDFCEQIERDLPTRFQDLDLPVPSFNCNVTDIYEGRGRMDVTIKAAFPLNKCNDLYFRKSQFGWLQQNGEKRSPSLIACQNEAVQKVVRELTGILTDTNVIDRPRSRWSDAIDREECISEIPRCYDEALNQIKVK